MDDGIAPDNYPQFTTNLMIFLIPRVFRLWDAVQGLVTDYFQQP